MHRNTASTPTKYMSTISESFAHASPAKMDTVARPIINMSGVTVLGNCSWKSNGTVFNSRVQMDCLRVRMQGQA